MRTVVCAVGIGGWYPKGIARLVNSIETHSYGIPVQAWINAYPPGSFGSMLKNGVDYGPYAAKAFALDAARKSGAGIAIQVDAAFYAVRHIQPLIQHIQRYGYYLCRNGFTVGEWSSDACLEEFKLSREDAFKMEEASSYCIGLNFQDHRAVAFLEQFKTASLNPNIIAGPHTGESHQGRNRGFVSKDPRVHGHRHDQTAASIIAHRLGMTNFVNRPRFTDYEAYQTEETVLVNRGGL